MDPSLAAHLGAPSEDEDEERDDAGDAAVTYDGEAEPILHDGVDGPRIVLGYPADHFEWIYGRIYSLKKHEPEAGKQSLPSWMKRMQWCTRTDAASKLQYFVPKACTATAITILLNDERWSGVLARNTFAECDVTRKPAPWHSDDGMGSKLGAWTDADITRLRAWFERAYGISFGANDLVAIVAVAAEANAYHPVCDYLEGLHWDGVERLPTLLSSYFGTADTPYTRAIGMRWMISAVARPMSPGCQVDCTLILEGSQGIGKSSGFRALVYDAALYSETGVSIGDKDSYQSLHGVWIYLLDELDSLRGADLTRTKNFLSSVKDHYRPTYGKGARDFFRQNVFCGTTNDDAYLKDRTGNRRFWPVKVVRPIDRDAIARDRDQLWAEAMTRYQRGEAWHVDSPELRRLCEAEQAERVQGDPWEPIVQAWLQDPIGALEPGSDGGAVRTRIDTSEGVLTSEVLLHALHKRPGDITKGDEMRVADVLKTLGYTRGPLRRERGERARRFVTTSSPPDAERR